MADAPRNPARTAGEAIRQGRVVRLHGKTAHVDVPGLGVLTIAVRGRLKIGRRRERSPIAVGDIVSLCPSEEPSATTRAATRDPESQEAEEGGFAPWHIEEVHERRTIVSRPSAHSSRIEQILAVNIDQLVATFAADTLTDHFELLDRLLVAARASSLEVVLLINKIDLADAATVAGLLKPYHDIAPPPIFTSARLGVGIDELRATLKDRASVFAGPSGAGKSSCLNALEHGLRLRTGEVSEKSGEGRHTTTHVSMLPLSVGGYVVDTPGVREFGLWNVPRAELALFYPDYAALLPNCRFAGCTHRHEPGCAVKAAVDSGRLSPDRYERYRRIWNAIEEHAY